MTTIVKQNIIVMTFAAKWHLILPAVFTYIYMYVAATKRLLLKIHILWKQQQRGSMNMSVFFCCMACLEISFSLSAKGVLTLVLMKENVLGRCPTLDFDIKIDK